LKGAGQGLLQAFFGIGGLSPMWIAAAFFTVSSLQGLSVLRAESEEGSVAGFNGVRLIRTYIPCNMRFIKGAFC
jgi:hypothetical protein